MSATAAPPENSPPRRIAHLDMDAFYASVELLRYPELRGLPVVIGGSRAQQPVLLADGERRFARLRDYAGRGVITTATYEARALGVFSAMGIMKAARLAPEAILLPVDFAAYRHYSRLFKAAVAQLAPQIEDRGIDEIYIDLSALADDTRTLAQRIKDAVRTATGLSCSICVAANKLLAKIGSDLDKPDGLTLLNAEDLRQRIWLLPARKINGIGPKASERLAALGIHSIGELAQADAGLLQQRFGRSYGRWLLAAAHGIDERPLRTSCEPKSISRETTFERDLHPRDDRQTLGAIFTTLCTQVAEDLRRKAYQGRTIGIKLRFADFQTVTRDLTLPAAIDDAQAIRRAAGECLRRVALDRKLRLLGVRVSALAGRSATESQSQPRQQELVFAPSIETATD
ncbi:MAG: DNA polymerase IV [Candidatus Accumulibacter appositus]|uniref:DNA polymerase IV n=1 Tax=Candidatus Accumulibacter appositus TaxID=1454003 RepID=A0A011ND05_9PROT|nr:DNA polymerase IV [Accumulibacter sp.]EXI80548.1 MAG: DNA polymerase IV [Candidatus Accumulibacter appositus]HRF03667.1 DNA polymerase IV [Accumulibacter sp.]